MTETAPKHVFLVDGSGFIFRAFHGLPMMTRPDGTPVNAVYGFTTMLMKLLDETDADHIAIIFDKARKTFRSDIYPEYKAHRPPPPEELIPQFDIIRQAVEAFNLPAIDHDGFEADDIIATYARLAVAEGANVTIVSSDKDLMQLVGDRVTMLDAMKNRVIGPEQVKEKFGVGPDKVIEVQALAGDSADNVPGVEGIGVKTAAQLLGEYGDLETLLSRAGEIKQPKRRERLTTQADRARISLQLVTLRDDVPVQHPLSDFAVKRPDPQRLLNFVKEQSFKSLIAKVEGRLTENGDLQRDAAAEAAQAGRDYELVQDLDHLKDWVAEAMRVGHLAVDTETTGLDSMQADLVGVCLSTEPGRACYVPLAHRTAGNQSDLFGDGAEAKPLPDQIPMDQALALLKPLLEDPAVLKIGQNLKYDMQILRRYGIELGPMDDTMLLSYVLEGGAHGHGMDELAQLHLGMQTIKFSDVAGSGKKQITFDLVPMDEALDYAAEDADVTLRLHRILKPRLVEEKLCTVYETLERPLVPVLRTMEAEGIKVDAPFLKELSTDFTARLGDLEQEIHKLAGREFNVGSPKQLGEILFDEMSLPGGKKGKTGAYATGASVLEDLAAAGHDLPARVLDWRQLAKLKSTYTDALLEQINPQTGRVHTSYMQTGAATGRLSSTDPNLQNIPIRTEEGRKLRKAFIAEPGNVLLSADYSQIELRLLAHVADIGVLKEAFHEGTDIHALTASQVFGVPVEGMDPMVRRNAKAINFGIIYGISAFGLARQLGISNGEAKDYIDAYFAQYPGIRAYMDETKQFAASHGYVTTLFGRRVHVRGINEKNPNARGFAERAAINAPIQGGAADIIKRAMIRVPGALAEADLGAKMLLQVHDELVFEVPEGESDATKAVVCRVMEDAADLSVPLEVDAGIGPTWAEAH
ncbi:DNA polymerase I [Magnetospira sp. QH-2]|uniref:DNA polymerase I n=1 Tax=Magnetospira sp. (strain QH-2) TaxID=1288970 RepID=UPI0003E80D29|nr:DNA polymerase I [Magnetospira sp. QH-2]CCQ75349.1 DNA polymerase I [Magnetospira sp. QH-2]